MQEPLIGRETMSILIVDYGMGNLASISNMIRKVRGRVKISSDKRDIFAATKLILPGVGAFDHGVEQLHKLDLFSAVRECAGRGTPLLGICLGMQLLAHQSEEGELHGLGLIDARVKRLSLTKGSRLRIPHVGWNQVIVHKKNSLIPVGDEQRYYFTHSYHAICENPDDILSTTEYEKTFVSAYHRHDIYGVQFHPEKSHRFGMALLKNFVDL
jgi:glutamine amidotransferase